MLQKQDRQLKIAVTDTVFYGACDSALTADALQGTWLTIDELSSATRSGKTYFGPQSPVDDTVHGQNACQQAGVIRSQMVPPTTDVLGALLGSLP